MEYYGVGVKVEEFLVGVRTCERCVLRGRGWFLNLLLEDVLPIWKAM